MIQMAKQPRYNNFLQRMNPYYIKWNISCCKWTEFLVCLFLSLSLQAELKVMDINALEEEQKALLSDKAGEMEYLQSLQERTEQIKVGI